ncbi:transporter substrate-binding domain-containing protein [Paraburkholderia tropica]|uniref:transporter substrate-binding domain-containing protein n=1 Tax=Paraburkholderia tropica TaxID=92647 RepID=UPI002AB73816|nr:transporter substrate-binding domain-containing protein [Paraburkholderia tropica]
MNAFKAAGASLIAGLFCFASVSAVAATDDANVNANANADANACTNAARSLAPDGTLRASINIGNPVLAALDANTHEPVGVSVDLAGELARRLGARVQLVTATSAAASLDNVVSGRANLGFFAIDPKRGEDIHFTAPYVLIEGAYAVRDGSPIARSTDVDQPGVSIAVSRGSAYDLYLSRALHHATLVRISPSSAVFDAFQKQHIDVLAGVKPQLAQEAASGSGLHLLDGRFMVIRQAMGVRKNEGDDAANCVAQFAGEMEKSGFVAEALARHHVDGASVAQPGD